MSHSISVSARNIGLRDEMYEFLQRVYRPWFDVLGEDHDDGAFLGPLIDEDLNASGTCQIGFEYDLGDDIAEREYHFAIMRWVALQVGKRRSRFRTEEQTLNHSVPFLLFGKETSPVFFSTEWPQSGAPGPVVDHLGMCVDDGLARELAWRCLPEGTFEKVSSTHFLRPTEEVQEAIISEGIQGAYECLSVIRSQMSRLDTVWKHRAKVTVAR